MLKEPVSTYFRKRELMFEKIFVKSFSYDKADSQEENPKMFYNRQHKSLQ